MLVESKQKKRAAARQTAPGRPTEAIRRNHGRGHDDHVGAEPKRDPRRPSWRPSVGRSVARDTTRLADRSGRARAGARRGPGRRWAPRTRGPCFVLGPSSEAGAANHDTDHTLRPRRRLGPPEDSCRGPTS